MFRDKEILRKIVSEKKEEGKEGRKNQNANVTGILRDKFPYLFGGDRQRESSVSLGRDKKASRQRR